jgi:uncharacterized FlaG/YvyC family protein
VGTSFFLRKMEKINKIIFKQADLDLVNNEKIFKKEIKTKIEKNQLSKILENMNRIMNTLDIQIRFSISEETKGVIIRVIDVKRNYVIREIPRVKIVRMVNEILKLAGLMFEKRI